MIKKFRRSIFAAVLALAIAAISTAALAGKGGSQQAGQSYRAVGKPLKTHIRLSAREQQLLRLLSRDSHGKYRFTGNVKLMAKRGDHAFYQLALAGGGACYSYGVSGPAKGVTTNRLESYACSERFPTPEPLLDFSIYEVSSSDPTSGRFISVQGFASDAVPTVGVRDASGEIVARVPVVNNTYHFASVPPQTTSVVAFDSSGSQVSSVP